MSKDTRYRASHVADARRLAGEILGALGLAMTPKAREMFAPHAARVHAARGGLRRGRRRRALAPARRYRVFVDSSLAVLGYTWSVAGNDYKKESAGFNQVFGRLNLATW